MKLFTKILMSCTVLCLSLNAKAQEQAERPKTPEQYPDYVIMMNGDSIPCNINISIFSGFRYSTTDSTKLTKIKPDKVKEYYVARRHILWGSTTKEDHSSRVFLELLEKGKINLYEDYYPSTYGVNKIEWYVSKGSDTSKKLKSSGMLFSSSRKERKDNFSELIKDNEAVYNKYTTENKFTYDQLRNLIHWYNTGQQIPPSPPDNHLDY
ncbi:hypothetical protein [Mucilaginibacter sp. NFX135]|uniref:hypothetical protein n=1 Tax=Mucilaginibacter sp. NFX135 TaxID=3402687 RepID=UPI003AFA3F82